MARIDSKVVFLTTSPRSPEKMIPEISLLNEHFSGQEWNNETQAAFMDILRKEDFFHGEGIKDPAFSARDRINRAPQLLGFVTLKPVIALTPAGKALTTSRRTEEVFLRQLLKFQLPSPYHIPSNEAAKFCVHPYLEIFRLIRHFGSLKFDELKIFGLQMTDYRNFSNVVKKIEKFRAAKARTTMPYKKFEHEYFNKELRKIYRKEISSGDINVRENDEVSEHKFLQTKANNMRDYADACTRYLRATGMVRLSHEGKSLSINPEKEKDVDFFLKNMDRKPCFVDNMEEYVANLGDAQKPMLYTDDITRLAEKIRKEFPTATFDVSYGIEYMKDLYADLLEQRKRDLLDKEIREIKDYRLYDDIQEKYRQISTKDALYDTPLMMEWNTWRAMTMLDGGNIKANLKFDDIGEPSSTAQGNMADIVCDYGDFNLTVEVTMAVGQKQYEMEGEPVSRHLGRVRQECNKPAYCLFIAPTINDACIAHFFTLHKINVSYYGGRSSIVPLPLKVFQKMLEDSRKADYIPEPRHVKEFFEFSDAVAASANDEKEWYGKMIEKAMDWLSQ